MNRSLARAMLLATVVVAAGAPLAAQQTTASAPPAAAAGPAGDGARDLPRTLLAEGAQPGDTHVRIVRLSQVTGKVYMDRNIGRGPEAVLQNMPIEQGMALATDGSGFAEVEFEDGSTLRLAPLSEVRLPLLVLRSSGARATTILVDRGIAYLHTQRAKSAEFTLAMGDARFVVKPGTHLRLDRTGEKAELAVISGEVSALAGGGSSEIVGKQHTLTLDPAGRGPTSVEQAIYENTYDEWDRKSMQYHDRYLQASRNMGSTPLYGASDMNYYGGFVNGCGGSFWQPYFIGAGWSPYAQGTWTLYSQGYSWVSPYPWGWLPFHTGAWSFCPGMGWGWRPGGSWYGVQNIGMMQATPGLDMRTLMHPPGGLRPGAQSMIVHAGGPEVRSTMGSEGSLLLRRDSAGLGVPRGALTDLRGLSREVGKNGSASVGGFVPGPAGGMVRSRAAQPVEPAAAQTAGSTTAQPRPAPQPTSNDRFSWKTQPRPANPPAPATSIPHR